MGWEGHIRNEGSTLKKKVVKKVLRVGVDKI